MAAKVSAGGGSQTSSATAQMIEYNILRVARSDGAAWTAEEINRASNAMAVTGPLDDSDPKVRRFMISLGRTVRFNLGVSPDENEYMVEPPEGYAFFKRVYDNEKKGSSKREDKKSTKREDILLFGHPKSVKLSYRTPKEFGPHLFWLISTSEDKKHCSCQFCITPAPAKKAKPVPAPRPVAAPVEAPRTAAAPVFKPAPAANATAVSSAPQQPQRVTTAAAPASHGQVEPSAAPLSSPNTDVFRIGELVWYVTGQAWRLGIVLSVNASSFDRSHHTCMIAPISHHCLQPSNIEKSLRDMRPFLSFSVPAVTIAEAANKSYTEVGWPELARQYIADATKKPEMVALEASKLAANMINASFSLFNKKQSIGSDQGIYGGVFLGAEQIRVGDAIRVQQFQRPDAAGMEVMLVKTIYNTVEAVDGRNQFHVVFMGDIYTIESTQNQGSPVAAGEQPNSRIFAEELALRDNITAVSGSRWTWRLLEKDVVRRENQVFGRFYLTNKLMEILAAKEYGNEVHKGVVIDSQGYLNKRMLTNNMPYVGRMPSRQATLGPCVSVRVPLGPDIVEDQM